MTGRDHDDEDAQHWRDEVRDVVRLASRDYQGMSDMPTMPAPPRVSVKEVSDSMSLMDALCQSGAAIPTYDRELPQVKLPRIDPNMMRRIRLGRLSIGRTLDLHDYSQAAAYERLYEFITICYQQDIRLVLVITGKGSVNAGGVLRRMVPRWLSEPQFAAMVAAMQPALPRHGGSGAYYIHVRRYDR